MHELAPEASGPLWSALIHSIKNVQLGKADIWLQVPRPLLREVGCRLDYQAGSTMIGRS